MFLQLFVPYLGSFDVIALCIGSSIESSYSSRLALCVPHTSPDTCWFGKTQHILKQSHYVTCPALEAYVTLWQKSLESPGVDIVLFAAWLAKPSR